jgi:hypothetical protein
MIIFFCRDPRSRMLLEQQEKKLSAGKPPDGAKLSFKEKMKLFAQEVGFSRIQLYYGV